jgi:type III secretion protein R
MKRRYFIYLFLAFALIGAFHSPDLFAADNVAISQEFPGDDAVVQPSIIQKVVILAAMALMPFAIMLLTSFMKMVVVLSLLRQALGVQNSPPNPVINGIAILMAIYVMFPTCMAMYNEGQDYIKAKAPKGDTAILSPQSVEYMIGVLDTSKEPMRKFLIRNCQQKHRTYFFQLAKQKFPAPYKNELKSTDFIVVVPAYITSQVKGAFEVGVLLYLPFFVIDLVVSNILLAMGMMMLSPLTIALPLKLLLLVMIDGWTLLIEGIVLTYR